MKSLFLPHGYTGATECRVLARLETSIMDIISHGFRASRRCAYSTRRLEAIASTMSSTSCCTYGTGLSGSPLLSVRLDAKTSARTADKAILLRHPDRRDARGVRVLSARPKSLLCVSSRSEGRCAQTTRHTRWPRPRIRR